MLVEPGVDPDVLGAHLLFCELLDLLDGAGCTVLETDPVEALVKVDGVLPGHHLTHGGSLLLVLRTHVGRICWKKETARNDKMSLI